MEGCSVGVLARVRSAWIASERALCSDRRVPHSERTITKRERELIELSRISSMIPGKDIYAAYRNANSRTKHRLCKRTRDWTGIVQTELFAPTYRSYGLATIRYPVLEVEARVEPFENGRGFSLRVMRAGKPRNKPASMCAANGAS
jgi:hypothetical protein